MLVQNTGNYVRHIGVRLIPGVNKLNESDVISFKEALEHPLNQYLVEHGEIIVPSDFGGKESDSISGLDANKAVELIKDTFELALLDVFLKEESEKKKRKTVMEAIDKQIESIKNPPEDKIVKDQE